MSEQILLIPNPWAVLGKYLMSGERVGSRRAFTREERMVLAAGSFKDEI